jgi:uncharacterized protein
MLPAIGYAIRRENRPILTDPAINAAEITFEQAQRGMRTQRFTGQLEFEHVSVHSLEMSLTSPELPPADYLRDLKDIADENEAGSISDHLGFTRDHNTGVAMGHFAPPPYSSPALQVTCRNIDYIQNYFQDRPFYIENIAYLFKFKGEMSEAEFLSNVLQVTGCGWLLDVTNVYANSLNHGYDAYEFIRTVMPRAPRLQMHLAGGFFDDEAGFYFDSHSEPIPDEVWKLYQFALQEGRGKVDAVFIERDANFPEDQEWRREVRLAREIAEQVADDSLLASA